MWNSVQREVSRLARSGLLTDPFGEQSTWNLEEFKKGFWDRSDDKHQMKKIQGFERPCVRIRRSN